jgi:hypothetical protein
MNGAMRCQKWNAAIQPGALQSAKAKGSVCRSAAPNSMLH